MSRPDAVPALPGLGQDAPAFAEPWQAEAFAMAVALNQRGAFTWSEWADALSRELASDGEDYHAAWLRALEAIATAKGLAAADQIDATAAAWKRAAHATPHGKPILLENDPEWRKRHRL